jgi:hypothetical protein
MKITSEILGSHGGEYEDVCLLDFSFYEPVRRSIPEVILNTSDLR